MGKTILIIDDDPDIVEAIQMTLEGTGYATVVTQKAEEALSKALECSPRLIILDLLLSGYDGRDIAQNLKNTDRTKTIPLLMISAHPDAEQRTKAVGADAFLAKPFDIYQLLAIVEELTEDFSKHDS
ncbi:response regulator [Ktedonosporobacter rubrisoli]|uniref:Response regulator n=1 Tax=Ktedonosporobacter rubrisoli TaxID=2509675 RepID=A0A4P6JM82_KTERU|nr:response regulator [Ktedonosporobacter rubrisoli]QBD76397.1 response regulator [Ktedonosporobacter rubrisoli]